MTAMSELFASGRIIDLVLSLVALEAMALVVYRRLTGRGVAGSDLLPNLASGASLLVAARLALTGQEWHWIAAALIASLAAHLLDLSVRWRAAGAIPTVQRL